MFSGTQYVGLSKLTGLMRYIGLYENHSQKVKKIIYIVSKKDTDVAHYITCQPILVVYGRYVAERVGYGMVIRYSTFVTSVSALPGEM